MLPVIETFSSLQGESTHAGRKCFFIRLAGCDLRCSYCDTAYAWEGGEERSVAELVDAARASGMDLVEVTGGEPLIHPETPALLAALLADGREVLLETNGARSIADVPSAVRKILDCKLPSSGMAEHNRYDNYPLLRPHDEVKFVVADRRDFDFACEVIRRYRLPERTGALIFSPVWGKISWEELAGWVIASELPIRMQLQMHKLIWGERRGV